MSDVTQILGRIEAGDARAAEQLLPLVYGELRDLAAQRMAQESPDHTLQPTALVHEAYVRLVDEGEARQWNSCGHFFAAAAEAMRRILVEHARAKKRLKRGGDRARVEFSDDLAADTGPDIDLLSLDEALDGLAAESPQQAELVKLRYFGGLTIPEAAQALGISHATAERYWTYARVWLFAELRRNEPEQSP